MLAPEPSSIERFMRRRRLAQAGALGALDRARKGDMDMTSQQRPTRPKLALRVALAALSATALTAGVANAQSATAQKNPPAKGASGVDLRTAGVFTLSNQRVGNEVIAFARAADGTLTRAGSYATGGTGSGSFEDSANGLVLGTSQGEAAPNNLIEHANLLFAVNPRSDNLSVFKVKRNRLQRVELQPSGGQKPVSVTVNRGIAYVLNSGEPTDDLFDSDGNVIPNCSTGTPSITGFRVSKGGQLDPIAGSTRRLSGLGVSGCAQVSFSPDGTVVLVTERSAGDEGAPGPEGDEGVIDTFTRNPDGTLSEVRVTEATGSGPFGFTFNKAGDLFTTEQFDGLLGPGQGAAAAYRVAADGTLASSGPSVPNGGTDTCWFVVDDEGRYGYATSFFGDGQISVYRTGPGGALELQEADAGEGVSPGASDISLTRSGDFLYQLNSLEGTVTAFRVEDDGGLTRVGMVTAGGPSAMAASMGLAAS